MEGGYEETIYSGVPKVNETPFDKILNFRDVGKTINSLLGKT